MIGIYGGTFDPVHYGHLRTAVEVRESLGLDELRFVPCRQPPHRGTPGATPEQRLAMLQLALANAAPGLRLDARELERSGPSYMIETLIALRREAGDESICLILGTDAFLGLPTWHRWKELTDFAHLVIMRRPEIQTEEVDPAYEEWKQGRIAASHHDLRHQPAGLLHFIPVSQLAISATGIRTLVRSHRSPRYLLPDPVLDYILAQRLYQN